jgi:outer membrane protein assembly factor BamB
MKKIIIIWSFVLLLVSSCTSCKDDISLDKDVYWKNKICGEKLIFDDGVGYPVYKNIVVFHSTPEPWSDTRESILYGLDTETGKEKWRLTNADFAPKKNLEFNNIFGTFQSNNILIASDDVNTARNESVEKYERYIFSIDIEKGEVLWVTPFPNEYRAMGNMIKGDGEYAFVNANNYNKCSLLKVNAETGELSAAIDVISNVDLPEDINALNPEFAGFYFTDIYQNNDGDDIVALSLMPYIADKPYMSVLYVYNLTKRSKIYTTTVTMDGSNFWIYQLNGKLVMGSQRTAFCYDAFENKKYWEKSVVLNDGIGFGSGNDEILQVMAYDNLALIFCVDRLVCFDINTGALKYNVLSSHAQAEIVDGVIYNEDDSDLVMRDVYTGKVLKRYATGLNEEGFARTRPNVVDGRVYIHSYTHAYCIKAWGK